MGIIDKIKETFEDALSDTVTEDNEPSSSSEQYSTGPDVQRREPTTSLDEIAMDTETTTEQQQEEQLWQRYSQESEDDDARSHRKTIATRHD